MLGAEVVFCLQLLESGTVEELVEAPQPDRRRQQKLPIEMAKVGSCQYHVISPAG